MLGLLFLGPRDKFDDKREDNIVGRRGLYVEIELVGQTLDPFRSPYGRPDSFERRIADSLLSDSGRCTFSAHVRWRTAG